MSFTSFLRKFCHEVIDPFTNHQLVLIVLCLRDINMRCINVVTCTFPSSLRYDAEAIFFDEGVRTAKRKIVEEKLLEVQNLLISLYEIVMIFFIKRNFLAACPPSLPIHLGTFEICYIRKIQGHIRQSAEWRGRVFSCCS